MNIFRTNRYYEPNVQPCWLGVDDVFINCYCLLLDRLGRVWPVALSQDTYVLPYEYGSLESVGFPSVSICFFIKELIFSKLLQLNSSNLFKVHQQQKV